MSGALCEINQKEAVPGCPNDISWFEITVNHARAMKQFDQCKYVFALWICQNARAEGSGTAHHSNNDKSFQSDNASPCNSMINASIRLLRKAPKKRGAKRSASSPLWYARSTRAYISNSRRSRCRLATSSGLPRISTTLTANNTPPSEPSYTPPVDPAPRRRVIQMRRSTGRGMAVVERSADKEWRQAQWGSGELAEDHVSCTRSDSIWSANQHASCKKSYH
jgi:hypothetical protein